MVEIRHTKDFEEFSFDRQCEIVKQVPFVEKAELILRSEYPQAIVEQLGPENFYIIANSADKELLPDLLTFANTDQLLFYTDFQCFEYDLVNEKKFEVWIKYLLDASDDKFLEWFFNMDFNFIVTAYKKLLRIIKTTPEEVMDEVLQDEQYFSIDFLYYICIKESHDFDTIKHSLELLFEFKKSLYVNLMECIIGEIITETEEEAYLSHLERLSESGFPEKDIAMSIYTPLTREEWLNVEKKHDKDISQAFKANIFAQDTEYLKPVIQSSDSLFIDDVLSYIFDRNSVLRDELHAEIMGITNKILALSMKKNYDLNEHELIRALNEAKGILNISLILLTDMSITDSAEILSHYWLEHIFRRGFCELIIYRKKAHSLIKRFKPENIESMLCFFSSIYECTLRGLIRLSPLFHDPEYSDTLYNLRGFQTPRDIEITGKRLSAIENILQVFSSMEDFNELFGSELSLNMPEEEITPQSVLFTGFANYTLSKTFSARPLDVSSVTSFFKMAFTIDKNGKHKINTKTKKEFFNFFESSYKEELPFVSSLLEESFKNSTDELERIDLSKAPDGRFIRSFCFFAK